MKHRFRRAFNIIVEEEYLDILRAYGLLRSTGNQTKAFRLAMEHLQTCIEQHQTEAFKNAFAQYLNIVREETQLSRKESPYKRVHLPITKESMRMRNHNG